MLRGHGEVRYSHFSESPSLPLVNWVIAFAPELSTRCDAVMAVSTFDGRTSTLKKVRQKATQCVARDSLDRTVSGFHEDGPAAVSQFDPRRPLPQLV